MEEAKVKPKVILPKEKVKASRRNPSKLIIYGPPKIGKTTLISQLSDTLILDLENGSNFVDAMKIHISSIAELKDVGETIKKEGRPYKRIAVDTSTELEKWAEDLAKTMYMETPIGKNFKEKSILTLPNGGGYLWLRLAFERLQEYIETLAEEIIYIGHLKDKLIERDGKEVSAKDIDHTGKIRSIICSRADAVGYIYRKDTQMWVTFKSSDEIVCGSRCDHLKGQEFEFNWDKIYID